MAVDWSHLPRLVISQICMGSTKECGNGFAIDNISGYQVCTGCRKPAIMVAVKECDLCGKTFVPKYYDKILNDWMGIACDECEPPQPPTTTG